MADVFSLHALMDDVEFMSFVVDVKLVLVVNELIFVLVCVQL